MTPYTPSQLRALLSSKEATGSYGTPPAVKRRPRKNEESRMQRELIRWWQMACRGFGVAEILLFSVPNGGNADPRRGSIMKLEGQRRGAPDLQLCAPRPGFHGLFLELKTPTGRVSPEQEVFHARLKEQGYAVEVCRSTAEAINAITNYLATH